MFIVTLVYIIRKGSARVCVRVRIRVYVRVRVPMCACVYACVCMRVCACVCAHKNAKISDVCDVNDTPTPSKKKPFRIGA